MKAAEAGAGALQVPHSAGDVRLLALHEVLELQRAVPLLQAGRRGGSSRLHGARERRHRRDELLRNLGRLGVGQHARLQAASLGAGVVGGGQLLLARRSCTRTGTTCASVGVGDDTLHRHGPVRLVELGASPDAS